MKSLIFLGLFFSFPVFSETFEEVTSDWNCIFDVELGAQGKSAITADFCIDGSYNQLEDPEPESEYGQAAMRARISGTEEIISAGPNGEDWIKETVTRSGCIMPGFSLNQCVIYSSGSRAAGQYEIAVQGPMTMGGEQGVYISPAIFIGAGDKALQPLKGEYPAQGMINRRFLKVGENL